jgi:hypothetical protein
LILVLSRARRLARPFRFALVALLSLLVLVSSLALDPAGGRASAAAPAASDPALLAAVRSALEARRRAVANVRSDVVVAIDAKGWAAAGTCEGLLAARRPASLRLAGYAALATLFDTATDGRRFWVLVPSANTMFTGTAGRESLLTGLPVPPGQIVSAVFGEPYGALDSTLTAERKGGKTWLGWRVGEGRSVRARATLEPFRLEHAELVRGDAVEATIDYRDYRKRDGVWWPTRIEFAWPAQETHLAIDFRTVTFGAPPPDSLFVLEAPPGTQTIALDEGTP